MKILFIDNFDSFIYNLVDEFSKRRCDVLVYRNNTRMAIMQKVIADFKPDLFVLSPGPSHPRQAGICLEIVKQYQRDFPFLGVCLGHQCLIEALGGKIAKSPIVMHGKPSLMRHDGRGIFKDLPNPFQVGRYHSLTAVRIPKSLAITARVDDIVMAVQHRQQPLIGVQFHPESVLTPFGGQIIENILEMIR